MKNWNTRLILNITLIVAILALIIGAFFFERLDNKLAAAAWEDETALTVSSAQASDETITTEASIAAPTVETTQENEPDKPVAGNLYDKLKAGQDIKVLLAGDSIAMSDGATGQSTRWQDILAAKLKEKYKSSIVLDELTQRNDTAFGGLFVYLTKPKPANSGKYDLILLCYGQQDMVRYTPASYSKVYEAFIRKLKTENPNAEMAIITGNTTSRVAYRDAAKSMAEYYNALYADMVDYFDSNDGNNGQTNVFRTPGDAEYKLYAEKLFELLSGACDQGKQVMDLAKGPINADLEFYDNLHEIDQFPFKKGFDASAESLGESFLSGANPGNIAEADFNGSICGLSVLAGSDKGIARVYIDRTRIRVVDCYSPEPVVRYVPVSLELADGLHRLRIEVIGTKNRLSTGIGIAVHGIIANR